MSSRVGSANAEYVNARVRSRRAGLYDEESYRRLLRTSPAEIARDMEESAYGREINELGSRFDGVDLIEYALNRNLARQFDDLLGWAEGSLYDLLVRYLRKFDAWNLKTLLRGVYSGTPADEVRVDMIRAGELDDDLLDRLADAGSIEEIVEGVSDTLFGDALAGALADYEDAGLLVPLENAVDRAYYELLTAELGSSDELAEYRRYLRAEIDFRNAINALRLARSGTELDPAAYFIAGGDLFSQRDVQRLAGNMDELVAYIRESTYGDDLSGALDELASADSLVGFERALEAAQDDLPVVGDAGGGVHPVEGTRGRQHPRDRTRQGGRARPRRDRTRVGDLMSKEIAVIGSPEFTTGFRLAGVRKFEDVPDDEKPESLDDAVERTLADEDVGIVVMRNDDLDHLSRGVRETVQESVDPVLVTLGGGAGGGGLREQIKRAIGIDLMAEDEDDGQGQGMP